ncbi:MAG: hypothetical protein HBSAPP04_11890 [Ignavibacteriaceae bacterium]|nr:MAG: hypothetical protein HBSAPP04_11890 [Ignavibacteriaceae bacterium]
MVNAPEKFAISEAYPNPFNGSTRFELNAPSTGEYSIRMMNSTGEVVYREMVSIAAPGKFIYDVDPGRYGLPSGVYFISFDLTGKREVRKIIYLK